MQAQRTKLIELDHQLLEASTHLERRGEWRMGLWARAMELVIRRPNESASMVDVLRSIADIDRSMSPAAIVADFERARAIWPEGETLAKVLALENPESSLILFEMAMAVNPCYFVPLVDLYLSGIRRRQIEQTVATVESVSAALNPLFCTLMQTVSLREVPGVYSRVKTRRGQPYIFLNTMPKSGSMYILNVLAKSLDYQIVPTCIASHMARDHLIPSWATAFSAGGMITQEHMSASMQNIAALRMAGIDRIVVHVRDPRQALLSGIYHIADRAEEMHSLFGPIVLPDFSTCTFSDRAQWMIEHFLPELIEWVYGWVRVECDPDQKIKVLFTRYESIHENETRLFESILEFHGLIGSKIVAVSKGPEVHFRKGKKDEWREAFNSTQIAAMNHQIPSELAVKFGWSA